MDSKGMKGVMRNAIMAAGALAFLSGMARTASAEMVFSAWMTGAAAGQDTTVRGRGVIGIKLNAAMDSARVFGAVTNLSGPVTSAFLQPGLPGQTGAQLISITDWFKGNSISILWSAIPRSTVDSMIRGLYYINVATAAHPTGEIRGQMGLERDTQFTADIRGTNEVPPVTTAADGMGFFQLSADDSTLNTWVVYSHPPASEGDTLIMAHFHIGPPGVNGPVAIDLTGDTSNGMMAVKKPLTSPLNGVTTAAFLDSLRKGSVYINFHSKRNPTGLMRGQLAPSNQLVFVSRLARNEAGNSGKGLTLISVSPDNAKLTVRSSFSGLSGPTTGASLRSGINTAVPFDSAAVASGGIASEITLANITTQGFTAGQFLTDLLMGRVSVNVNTAANPRGELTAPAIMPVRIGFAFRLDGSQETPPVATRAFGAGVATMDMDSLNLRWTVVADSLDSTYTGAHFHKEAPGKPGAIVFDITNTFVLNPDSLTGLYSTGLWTSKASPAPFSKSLARAMLAESLYVNIHTKRNPAGAIRGQLANLQPAGVPILARSRKAYGGYGQLAPAMAGNALRFQGLPGGALRVRILGMNGRILSRARLDMAESGLSEAMDLSALRPGMYIAAWDDALRGGSARFVKP